MRINLIYARAANGVIGRDNAMPWHLPQDLAHFRRHTQGCPVVMGRATWESLPARFRPLPGRLNLVLTRDPQRAAALQAEGAVPVDSLEAALARCRAQTPAPAEVWVMGGAQIYAQAEPLAQRALVTEIDRVYDGDAHAPTLGPDWTETARERHRSDDGLAFAFVTYERRPR
ncbi:dihydrofolate reductase [Aquabacterium sp. A08]|uniref:dihydrofolate reductase n=1 Tax=Aquabacterium sp. A08 TaxID=2718532 RepID=UPI00141FD88F|nr:dihydrofolate reductase [Aquabacterium sp. A08]NIC40951.1 dihydrofolate reductase [Aquabacterium sp. A08]NIC40959.1 dihydrofolate reductase [Aquabacterium sp. A08]NIC42088.1 dihydrofolate reductase [Aquabacterium sp. A08]NIC42136.1 dihydrofolate reductase [Aquabacterium sp. A08]